MKRINSDLARKKLIKQWLIFSAVIFSIYLFQTMTQKYQNHEKDVWEWLFRFITPPLSLMIGVLITHVSSQPTDDDTDSFYLRLTQGISYFYLSILLLSAVLVPIINILQNQNLPLTDQKTIIQAFNTYSSVLTPIQGICTLALGFFFTKK